MLKIPCLIAAAVCFALKAFNVSLGTIDLTASGFFFVVVAFIV
jgi:hypothetical protein